MSRYDLVQTDGLIAPAADSGGGASGDLALSTGGLATRSDLNAQSLTATATGGTAPLSYSWSATRPDGTVSTSEFTPNATTQNPTFTPARVGLYSVTCTVTDSAGTPLTASSTQAKTVGTALSLSFSGYATTTDLSQQSLTATAAGGVGSYSYAWSCIKPDGSSSTAEFSDAAVSNPNFTPASAGLHVVTCTVTDGASDTASDTQSKDLGTGITQIGVRQQLNDLTGWTSFNGSATNAQFQAATSITASSGTFTLAWSNLVDAGGLDSYPTYTLNAPKELGIGYYSPASILSSVPFDGTPGVLTLRIEQASAVVATDTGGADTPGEIFLFYGITNGPYNGSDTAVDFFHIGVGLDLNTTNSVKPYVGAGGETASLSAGTTRSPSPDGSGIYDLHIMINRAGNPVAGTNFTHYGATAFARDLSISTTATSQFAVTDDTRLFVGLGCTPSIAHNASVTCRLYWSYAKIGA